MRREQMIERAARILWYEDVGSVAPGLLEWETTSNADSYRAQVRTVVDALLPQVTTVEERQTEVGDRT